MSDDLTDPSGHLEADDPLLSEQTFHDDGDVRVRYVPTQDAFSIGLTVGAGGETLLGPSEAEAILTDTDRFDTEVREAIERAVGTCRFATFADAAGRDTLEAYKRGDISAEEFTDEVIANVDRAIERRDRGDSQ